MKTTITYFSHNLPSDILKDAELNYSLIKSDSNGPYMVFFSIDESELHKLGLKLIKHPNSKRIERKYKRILAEIGDEELAKKHDDNVQTRRDAVRMLKKVKVLQTMTDIGKVAFSVVATSAGALATITVAPVKGAAITIVGSISLIMSLEMLLDNKKEFNKAIKAIIKDYKKSLINNKIYDTIINLEYEYPNDELVKLDRLRSSALVSA